MALTATNRREGVTAEGKRRVTYLCTFSDGTAADLTKAVLGLRVVDSVWVVAKTSAGIAIDLTANDSTKVTLDPSGAGAHDVIFVGSE